MLLQKTYACFFTLFQNKPHIARERFGYTVSLLKPWVHTMTIDDPVIGHVQLLFRNI